MFSFYDQLIIYLCEIRDRARLIARLVTRSRGLARLNTVWYQHHVNDNKINENDFHFEIKKTSFIIECLQKTRFVKNYENDEKLYFELIFHRFTVLYTSNKSRNENEFHINIKLRSFDHMFSIEIQCLNDQKNKKNEIQIIAKFNSPHLTHQDVIQSNNKIHNQKKFHFSMKLNVIFVISSFVNENMTSFSKNEKIDDDFRWTSFKNDNENVFNAISVNIDQFDAHYFIDNDIKSANSIDNWKFYAFHMFENDFETVVLSSSNFDMNEISNFVLILNFWCDKKKIKKNIYNDLREMLNLFYSKQIRKFFRRLNTLHRWCQNRMSLSFIQTTMMMIKKKTIQWNNQIIWK